MLCETLLSRLLDVMLYADLPHTWARVYERPADAYGGVMMWLVMLLYSYAPFCDHEAPNSYRQKVLFLMRRVVAQGT